MDLSEHQVAFRHDFDQRCDEHQIVVHGDARLTVVQIAPSNVHLRVPEDAWRRTFPAAQYVTVIEAVRQSVSRFFRDAKGQS